MLTDPIIVPSGFPADGGFPAVSREPNKSVYRLVDGSKTYTFTISHQLNKTRTRSMMRVDVEDIASDPLIPANSRNRSVSAYLVFDFEPGFSAAQDVVNAVTQLMGLLGVNATVGNITTTTIARIVAGES